MGKKKTKRQYMDEARAYRREVERRDERLENLAALLAEAGIRGSLESGVRVTGSRLQELQQKVEELREESGHLCRQRNKANEEVGELRRECSATKKLNTTLMRVVEILADKFPR